MDTCPQASINTYTNIKETPFKYNICILTYNTNIQVSAHMLILVSLYEKRGLFIELQSLGYVVYTSTYLEQILE
jgi:hypothetical protein